MVQIFSDSIIDHSKKLQKLQKRCEKLEKNRIIKVPYFSEDDKFFTIFISTYTFGLILILLSI